MGCLENDLDAGLLSLRDKFLDANPNASLREILNLRMDADPPKEVRSVFYYDYTEVLNKINMESSRARAKHAGTPQASEMEALSVLVEEVGEVATAINQNQPKAELEKEIVQVASIVLRWLMGDLTFSRRP